jgi:hypothetical protein
MLFSFVISAIAVACAFLAFLVRQGPVRLGLFGVSALFFFTALRVAFGIRRFFRPYVIH